MQLNLRHFRRGRRRSGAVVAHTGYALHQQDPHEAHRNIRPHANALCHFHIAASINPATGKKCSPCSPCRELQLLLGMYSLWKLSRCICEVFIWSCRIAGVLVSFLHERTFYSNEIILMTFHCSHLVFYFALILSEIDRM